MTEKNSKKLPFLEKFYYGGASFGNTIHIQMVNLYLLFFYVDVIGLKPAYVSFAILAANIWDAVTDPLMGFISDHTHSRFGRRRVYLLLAAVPLGITFYLTFAPPSSLAGFSLFIYLLFLLSVLYVLFTMVGVPYMALGAELSADPEERSSVFGFSYVAYQIGALAGMSIPNLVLEFSDDAIVFLHARLGLFSESFTERALGYLIQPTNEYRLIAAFIGVVACCGILVTFFGTRERMSYQPEKVSFTSWKIFANLYRDLLATLKGRAFVILMIANLAISVGTATLVTLWVFTAKYWLKMENLLTPMFLSFSLSAMISAMFWVWISKSTTKKTAFALGQLVLTIALFTCYIMVEGRPVLAVGVMAFIGAGAGVFALSGSIIADLVDYDEFETSKRREGAFYGVFNLISGKGGWAVGAFIAGLYLEIIGFENNVEMTPEVLFMYKLIYPICAFIVLMGFIAFLFFPYDKEEHARIQREIEQRKEQAVEHQSLEQSGRI
jgi:GPH family glycoside/pentoside/hexuronide:cation symporter